MSNSGFCFSGREASDKYPGYYHPWILSRVLLSQHPGRHEPQRIPFFQVKLTVLTVRVSPTLDICTDRRQSSILSKNNNSNNSGSYPLTIRVCVSCPKRGQIVTVKKMGAGQSNVSGQAPKDPDAARKKRQYSSLRESRLKYISELLESSEPSRALHEANCGHGTDFGDSATTAEWDLLLKDSTGIENGKHSLSVCLSVCLSVSLSLSLCLSVSVSVSVSLSLSLSLSLSVSLSLSLWRERERETDRQAGRQAGRQTDRQTDRQTS